MSVRKIIRMGHPVLRQVAKPLAEDEIGSDTVYRLVCDMIDTLHDYGGIGLAAPQINESIRVAIVELPEGMSRYGELPEIPLTVFVNPEIEILDPTPAGYWEGCLSIPGLRGFVERPQHIRVRAQTLAGESIDMRLEGFAATVLQHEFDHLDGCLYVDRITDPTRFAYDEEFDRYILPEEPSAE